MPLEAQLAAAGAVTAVLGEMQPPITAEMSDFIAYHDIGPLSTRVDMVYRLVSETVTLSQLGTLSSAIEAVRSRP